MTHKPDRSILHEMEETQAQCAELLNGIRQRVNAIEKRIQAVAGRDVSPAQRGEQK